MKPGCISPSIEFFSEANGRVSVFNKSSGKMYALGEKEYGVLIRLDGTKTADEISMAQGVFSSTEVDSLIGQFAKIGFLKGTEQKRKQHFWKVRKGLLNGNKLINPDKLFWKIIYNILIWGTLPVFLLGCVLSLPKLQLLMEAMAEDLFSANILLMLPTMLAMLSLHEMGHVLVARMQRVNVPEVGVMVYWFMPCAYTNLSGISFLKSKYKKILCLSAGILTNLFVAGVSLLVVALSSSSINQFLTWLALANISLSFFNLQIFIKLDGYFILQELLEISKLRESAFARLRFLFKSSRPARGSRQKYTARQYNSYENDNLHNTVLTLYSVASCLYLPVLIMSLLLSMYPLFVRWFL